MDILTFINYTIAILELVFFILAIFYLIKGLQKKDYKNFKKYGAIYLILNFTRLILSFLEKEATAVSIIGGADGPTSIFIAGKVGNTPQLIFCFFVILAGIGIGIYFRKKK